MEQQPACYQDQHGADNNRGPPCPFAPDSPDDVQDSPYDSVYRKKEERDLDGKHGTQQRIPDYVETCDYADDRPCDSPAVVVGLIGDGADKVKDPPDDPEDGHYLDQNQ